MSVLLMLLLFLHGLIHFMGFAKAFSLAEIPALSQSISKPLGLLWLLAGLLLLGAMLAFYLKRPEWWWPGAVGLVISQGLIISSWQDARFGSLANLLLVLPVLVGAGSDSFARQIQAERAQIQTLPMVPTQIVTEQDLSALPPIVQKWLMRSGQVGHKQTQTLSLSQSGSMRTSQQSQWMSFTADQFFRADQPTFHWRTRVEMIPGVFLVGRDRLWQGQGQMLIKALALVPVVNASGPEIDQGSYLRYLAEMIWFPSSVLQSWIKWENVDKTSARAYLNWQDHSFSGLYRFSPEGDFRSFEAQRYYGSNSPPSLETWLVEAEPDSIKAFGHLRLASRYRVIWKLKSGDFLWLKIQLGSMDFKS